MKNKERRFLSHPDSIPGVICVHLRVSAAQLVLSPICVHLCLSVVSVFSVFDVIGVPFDKLRTSIGG